MTFPEKPNDSAALPEEREASAQLVAIELEVIRLVNSMMLKMEAGSKVIESTSIRYEDFAMFALQMQNVDVQPHLTPEMMKGVDVVGRLQVADDDGNRYELPVACVHEEFGIIVVDEALYGLLQDYRSVSG